MNLELLSLIEIKKTVSTVLLLLEVSYNGVDFSDVAITFVTYA